MKVIFAVTAFLISLFLVPQTVLAGCSNYSSCSECLKHINDLSCIWSSCSNKCQTVDDFYNSGGTCGVDFPDKCGGEVTPASPPTVKVLPTPTSTPALNKSDGQSCRVSLDCQSGNCTNYVCCLKNKTCCSQNNSCLKDQYCSTKNDRYYCIPKLDNGMSCTDYGQCKSNQCGKGICCGGQPCCKVDGDCGKDEYCETKDNLYYCRVKWDVGEKCEKPSACRSGFCDTYTQKCAESSNPPAGGATPTPEKAVCGDNSCDDWLGENCCNCAKDCANITDFCCSQDSKYARSRDRQNKIFYLYDAPGGAIPNSRLVVPKGTDEKTFFDSYKPQICSNGKIISGECNKSDDCVKGICVDNKCTSATSDEPQAVTDKKVVEAIANEQNEYRKESVWVPVYDKIKGTILRTNKVEGGLEVRLEVQGATAGNMATVKIGGNIETRLEIVNNTAYYNAVIGGIVYKNPTQVEQKKYTLSVNHLESNSAILGMIGVAGAQRLGGKYFVLPPYYKLTVQSTVSPKQEGYLDISGIVYYSTENMYANSSLSDQINNVPVNYETNWKKIGEVTNSISVVPKKCSWGICL